MLNRPAPRSMQLENAIHGHLLPALYQVLDEDGTRQIFFERLSKALPVGHVNLYIFDLLNVEFSAVHAFGMTREEVLYYTTKWRDPWSESNSVCFKIGPQSASRKIGRADKGEATARLQSKGPELRVKDIG